MSDINSYRLPIVYVIGTIAVVIGPYSGDEVNITLNRGDE